MTSSEDGAPSKEVLYVVMAILAFLSLTGTAGNALVLYVFSRKRDKLVSTLFIIVLAAVDFVTCLVIMPMTIYMEYFDFHVASDSLCRIYQFLITSNIPFSALIMVAIAVDRYLSICHPFLRALNPERAKVVIGGLAILAAGFGVCVSLMFSVYTVEAVVVMTQPPTNEDLAPPAINISMATDESRMSRDSITRSTTDAEEDAYGVGRRMLTDSAAAAVTPDMTGHQTDQLRTVRLVNKGHCETTDSIISQDVQYYYQKLYTTVFLVCLVAVLVLYMLIFRSVLDRRARRQRQKSQALPLVVSLRGKPSSPQSHVEVKSLDETALITDESRTTCSDEDPPSSSTSNGSRTSKKRRFNLRHRLLLKGNSRRRKSMLDGNRMANLKTAAMLFVVTVTFIVTFLPAFLMAMTIIPYNMVVFYLYFANNVANPVIYSFMNKNFRQDLKKLFTECSQSTLL